MSVQDYLSAVKIGKKEYHACVNKGTYPYLPVLEDIIDENSIDREVSLGSDQIPLRLVVGLLHLQTTSCLYLTGEQNFQQSGLRLATVR